MVKFLPVYFVKIENIFFSVMKLFGFTFETKAGTNKHKNSEYQRLIKIL